MSLSSDVWRLIFSFLDLSDLPAVFCVKFFQPAWQHQQFWLRRFLQDFPHHLANILDDEACRRDVYLPWQEIRRVYKHLYVHGPHQPQNVNMETLKVVNFRVVGPDRSSGCRVGKPIYRGGQLLRIITPICMIGRPTTSFNMEAYLPMYLDGLADDDTMLDFFNFLMHIDEWAIRTTVKNSPAWFKKPLTFAKCRKLLKSSLHQRDSTTAPVLFLKMPTLDGQFVPRFFGADGNAKSWPKEWSLRTRGWMVLRLNSYYITSGPMVGVKWGLEELHLN